MKQKPNILWICTDQQRYDTIGALNNPHIRTPNIDRLVGEGVAFTHAFCQSPICTPSRASFLTGMYPSSVHGCMNGNERWAEAAPLVTALLADAGYTCGLAGKLHLAGAQGRLEPRPEHDGYQVFHWSHGVHDRWKSGHAYADWLREKGHNLGEMLEHPEQIPPQLHQTTWCADRAIEFMEENNGDHPWLMSVNMFDPHAPFDPPQSYLERYDVADMPGPLFRESDIETQAELIDIDFQTLGRYPDEFDARLIQAAYYAMIELIDENVGRMLDALEQTGQRENTVVIFMSDHGEALGDHGLLLKGCRFYEGLVRVPLIFSWPGHFSTNDLRSCLVELTDIAPTLLELADLPIPERMQGRSLHAHLTQTEHPDHHRNYVRCEYYRALNPIANDRFNGTYGTMFRDQNHKLVVYHGHEIGELYDLSTAPGEFNNLWNDPAYREIKLSLMKQSFDALALATDVGTKQVTRF
ncbi:sulfatase-like hydrolase/transferase [Chloroflexi bacterium TSY]|nr:sulfatase-like hydrolase/transferase [Chloroflexi bacterium TSY]